MMLSYEDKVLVKNLHPSKGYGARKLMSEFPDKNWKRSSLDKLLKKIQQTWHNIDQSIIDNAMTSGASVLSHACRQTADTLSKCCRKQHAYLHSAV